MERFEDVGCIEMPQRTDVFRLQGSCARRSRQLSHCRRPIAGWPTCPVAFKTASFEGTPYAFRTATLRDLSRHHSLHAQRPRSARSAVCSISITVCRQIRMLRRRDLAPLAQRLGGVNDAAYAIIAFLGSAERQFVRAGPFPRAYRAVSPPAGSWITLPALFHGVCIGCKVANAGPLLDALLAVLQ